MLAAGTLLAACATPGPPPEPCAFYGPLSEDDAVLASPNQAIMMLDGRPLVVPLSRRGEAGCDLGVVRMPAGTHTIHVSVQLTGFSPYAADTYTAQACSFVAQPGHRYRMQSEKEILGDDVQCTIQDLTTGQIVGQASSSGSDLGDYFEMVRAYAGCDEPVAQGELARLRGSGLLRRSFSEWEVRPCDAFLDLR